MTAQQAQASARSGQASPRPPRRPTAADGLLIVDKPQGWTSHDVVGRCRQLAGTRKVGHAGTLDPMATGVLVLGVGKATKLLTYVVGADKQYTATIRLGVGTHTDDAQGQVTSASGFTLDRPEDLDEAIAQLTGDIVQVPSSVSAIKVDGQRAYARVRAGQDLALKARPVTVSQFDVTAIRPVAFHVPEAGHVRVPADAGVTGHAGVTEAGCGTADVGLPAAQALSSEMALSNEPALPVVDVDVSVTVSSGTYVRALARDLGSLLGTAGHLTALRRTRVGGYTLDQALTLEQMEAQADADGVLATCDMATAVASIMPVRHLDVQQANALGFGQWIDATGQAGVHAGLGPDGALVALLEDHRRLGKPLAKPVLVFAATPTQCRCGDCCEDK